MRHLAIWLLCLGFLTACQEGPDNVATARRDEPEEEQTQSTEAANPVEVRGRNGVNVEPAPEALDPLAEQPDAALDSGGGPYVIDEDIEPPKRLGDSGPIDGLVTMMQSGEYLWGVCLFQVTISETGQVGDVVFLKPESLAPEVEEVISEGVQEWEFSPATMDGDPVAVFYNLLIHHCPYHRIVRN